MKRILVTGGAGFLGRSIVSALRAEGHEVWVLDDFSRSERTDKWDVEDDVRHVEDINSIAGYVDTVVHLAAINGTDNFYKRPGDVLSIGVEGTLSVIKACKAAGVKELFFASSSEVYQSPGQGQTNEKHPLTIPDPRNPRYSYAASKIIGEMMMLHMTQDIERVVIFRPHNVYGPAMGFDHVIPQLTQKIAASDGSITMLGNGQQVRAFCHIDDFVAGFMCLFDKGEHREIYNIGAPEPVRIIQLADLISVFLRKEKKLFIDHVPAPEGETRYRCPDITKIRALGYEPRITLADGLPAVVRWYREQMI